MEFVSYVKKILLISLNSKMIDQCLQKKPADRPTAKQLLKHDFCKKAKDRLYISKHLALKFRHRSIDDDHIVQKRKLQHMRSIRVIDEDEWTFSSGSDDENLPTNEDQFNKLSEFDHQTVHTKNELPESNALATESVIFF